MLSGRRAFQRPTRAETLAAIIREEPEPLAALCPRIPVPLLWIVERCMAKLPDERYAATRDLARDLQSVRDHFSQIDSGAEGAPLLVSAGPRHSRAWLSAGVAAAFAALVASAYLLGTGAADRALPSFHRLTFRDGTIWSARFAPDARTIVYGAAWNGAPDPDLLDAPRGAGVRGAGAAARDRARRVARGRDGDLARRARGRAVHDLGTLARASLSGGAPREVLESVQGADFSPDGASLAVLRVVDGRNRIEFPIGKPIYETGAGFLPTRGSRRAASSSPSSSIRCAATTPARSPSWTAKATSACSRPAGSRRAGSPGRPTAAKSGSPRRRPAGRAPCTRSRSPGTGGWSRASPAR